MKPSILKRLASSNWWWYEDVHPAVLPQLDERPRFWTKQMIFALLFGIIVLIYPTVASILNYDIPLDRDLLTLNGKVISVSKKNPHIELMLSSGGTVYADFPVTSVFGPMEARKFFDYAQRDLVLQCKDAEVSGQYLRYIPIDRFRIWEFKCLDHSFALDRAAIRQEWKRSRDFGWKFGIAIDSGYFILMMSILFFRERKDHGIKG